MISQVLMPAKSGKLVLVSSLSPAMYNGDMLEENLGILDAI